MTAISETNEALRSKQITDAQARNRIVDALMAMPVAQLRRMLARAEATLKDPALMREARAKLVEKIPEHSEAEVAARAEKAVRANVELLKAAIEDRRAERRRR